MEEMRYTKSYKQRDSISLNEGILVRKVSDSAPPVKYVIFLLCKDEQGDGVAHQANAGHGEEHQALHQELKGQLWHLYTQKLSV